MWPPKTTTTTTTTKKPTTTKPVIEAVEGELTGKKCSDGHRYTPNKNDCSRYYRCVISKWSPKQCAGGLMFDTTTKRCNWANIVNCGKRRGKIG